MRRLCGAGLEPRADACRPAPCDPDGRGAWGRGGAGDPGRRGAGRCAGRRGAPHPPGAAAAHRAAGRRARRTRHPPRHQPRHHHSGRQRLRRPSRRRGGPGRAAQGAHRPCAARQGACGMGQPLRRGHDRPDRLRLRLPRHGERRHPADAGHRLSLSRLLSEGGAHRADRPRPRRPGPPDAAGAGSDRRRGRHHRRTAAATPGPRRPALPRRRTGPLREGAKAWTTWPCLPVPAGRCIRSTWRSG